jgi:hypothetical protein
LAEKLFDIELIFRSKTPQSYTGVAEVILGETDLHFTIESDAGSDTPYPVRFTAKYDDLYLVVLRSEEWTSTISFVED